MAIAFAEMQGSPTETLTLQGWAATRLLKVAWDDRKTFIEEIFREEYPALTIPGLVCTSATAAPLPAKNTGSGELSAYEIALVTATYGVLSLTASDGGPGIQISESIEPLAEFLTVSATNLRWGANDGDNVGADEAPGKLFVGFDYIYAVEGSPTLPKDILDLVGMVNDKEVVPKSEGMDVWRFPPETLLYNPPSISRKFNEAGAPEWNLVYRFSYKPNKDGADEKGWNYFWRVDPATGTGKYEQMFVAGEDGLVYRQYPLGDFSGVVI